MGAQPTEFGDVKRGGWGQGNTDYHAHMGPDRLLPNEFYILEPDGKRTDLRTVDEFLAAMHPKGVFQVINKKGDVGASYIVNKVVFEEGFHGDKRDSHPSESDMGSGLSVTGDPEGNVSSANASKARRIVCVLE